MMWLPFSFVEKLYYWQGCQLINFCFIFQKYVDVDLFLSARNVEDALRMKKSGPCLAWCYENKSKLRKMKVCSCCF